jgi:hypothetical protein
VKQYQELRVRYNACVQSNRNDCEKHKGNDNLKGTVTITEYDRSETTARCVMFKIFV